MINMFFNVIMVVTIDLLLLHNSSAVESSHEEEMDIHSNLMVTGQRVVTHNTPNLGYEVYWNQTSKKSRKPVTICDQPCHDMYMSYGVICARNQDFMYRTFANPCEMFAVNCKIEKEWMITRRGKCYPYWGPSRTKWTLWINKVTLPPDLQKVYDQGQIVTDKYDDGEDYRDTFYRTR